MDISELLENDRKFEDFFYSLDHKERNYITTELDEIEIDVEEIKEAIYQRYEV